MWINAAGATRACTYYGGRNDASTQASTNCLVLVSPSWPSQLRMPENFFLKKKKKKQHPAFTPAAVETHASWGISSDIQLQETQIFTGFCLFYTVEIRVPDTSWERAPPTSNTPPPSSLLSPFAHYGDLFMNTTGSGDYIPFTTPGVYFQCSTYTVFSERCHLGVN